MGNLKNSIHDQNLVLAAQIILKQGIGFSAKLSRNFGNVNPVSDLIGIEKSDRKYSEDQLIVFIKDLLSIHDKDSLTSVFGTGLSSVIAEFGRTQNTEMGDLVLSIAAAKNNASDCAMVYAASWFSTVTLLQNLYDRGVPITAPGCNNPLEEAVSKAMYDSSQTSTADLSAINWLISKKADLNAQSPLSTALVATISVGPKMEVLNTLLVAGANPNFKVNGHTPLQNFCDEYEMKTWGYSERPLSASSAVTLISRMKDAGADLNQNYLLMDMLDVKDHADAITFAKALVSLGADVNLRDDSGDTPLIDIIKHYGMFDFRPELIPILASLGADMNVKNRQGKTLASLLMDTGAVGISDEAAPILKLLHDSGTNLSDTDPTTGENIYLKTAKRKGDNTLVIYLNSIGIVK